MVKTEMFSAPNFLGLQGRIDEFFVENPQIEIEKCRISHSSCSEGYTAVLLYGEPEGSEGSTHPSPL